MECIRNSLNKFLKAYDILVNFNVIENIDKNNGNFSSNIAFKLIKNLNNSPYEIGMHIKKHIEEELKYEFEIDVTPNGYMNFYFTKKKYENIIEQIFELEEKDFKNFKNQDLSYFYYRIDNITNILYKIKNIDKYDNINFEYDYCVINQIMDIIIKCFEKIISEDITDLLLNIKYIFEKYEEDNTILYEKEEKIIDLIIILNCVKKLISYNNYID